MNNNVIDQAKLKKVSTNKSNIDGQPEIAMCVSTQNGGTYISDNVTNIIIYTGKQAIRFARCSDVIEPGWTIREDHIDTP